MIWVEILKMRKNSITVIFEILGNDKLIRHQGDRSAVSARSAFLQVKPVHYFLLSMIGKVYERGFTYTITQTIKFID